MLIATRQTYKECVGPLLNGTGKLLTNSIKRLRCFMASLPQFSWVRSVSKCLPRAMVKQTAKNDQVREHLNKLDICIPTGPGRTLDRVLRELSDILARSFSVIFERVVEMKVSPE